MLAPIVVYSKLYPLEYLFGRPTVPFEQQNLERLGQPISLSCTHCPPIVDLFFPPAMQTQLLPEASEQNFFSGVTLKWKDCAIVPVSPKVLYDIFIKRKIILKYFKFHKQQLNNDHVILNNINE
jgi:hypothetical protein